MFAQMCHVKGPPSIAETFDMEYSIQLLLTDFLKHKNFHKNFKTINNARFNSNFKTGALKSIASGVIRRFVDKKAIAVVQTA